jgi:hypothetical protein
MKEVSSIQILSPDQQPEEYKNYSLILKVFSEFDKIKIKIKNEIKFIKKKIKIKRP